MCVCVCVYILVISEPVSPHYEPMSLVYAILPTGESVCVVYVCLCVFVYKGDLNLCPHIMNQCHLCMLFFLHVSQFVCVCVCVCVHISDI